MFFFVILQPSLQLVCADECRSAHRVPLWSHNCILGNKHEMRSVWTLQASHKIFRRSMVLLFLETTTDSFLAGPRTISKWFLISGCRDIYHLPTQVHKISVNYSKFQFIIFQPPTRPRHTHNYWKQLAHHIILYPNFTWPKSAIIVNAKYIVCFSFWQIRLICDWTLTN